MLRVPNAHSHAFQYAMAGKAEYLSAEASQDNFWSWREQMYQLALSISPEKMQEVATALYKDMLAGGYDWVAEFHYLHHQEDGSFYSNKSEMSERLIQAARDAGIGITLVPVFYKNSNFGKEASERQRRFIFKDVDNYLNLVEELKKKHKETEKVNIGCGVHSLRAADKEDIKEILKLRHNKTPFHIHISEQVKEVDDCVAFYQARPVEWLLSEFDIDENCHLVHATHINEKELQQIIQSKSNVVLCPSTEANLGDGIFPLAEFHHAGGRWCIGSDSHVCRKAFEELRWVEYTQRLVKQKRNPLCVAGGDNSAVVLLRSAIENGRRACGRDANLTSRELEVLKTKSESFSCAIFADSEPLA